MTGKRKRDSAESRAKVALEAIKGELTIAQLVTKHGVHQTLLNAWKRQAVEGLAAVFAGQAEAAGAAREAERGRGREAARQDRRPRGGAGFFAQGLRTMGVARRRGLIEPDHPRLSLVRPCELVALGRSSFHARPVGERAGNLALMRRIDERFLATPWYGARQMGRHRRRQGPAVGRKRVRRLMAKMGLAAVYQRPGTTVPHPAPSAGSGRTCCGTCPSTGRTRSGAPTSPPSRCGAASSPSSR